jgi:hypothetical protein
MTDHDHTMPPPFNRQAPAPAEDPLLSGVNVMRINTATLSRVLGTWLSSRMGVELEVTSVRSVDNLTEIAFKTGVKDAP